MKIINEVKEEAGKGEIGAKLDKRKRKEWRNVMKGRERKKNSVGKALAYEDLSSVPRTQIKTSHIV